MGPMASMVVMASMLIVVVMLGMVVMLIVAMAIRLFVMLIDMNLAVKVFRFTPHQGWTNGGFNREATVIAKTPLHH
ncbi:MAG: Uncharacterised protein [Prochlorococcus marinus str. MIT 9313]|nr:MAG: Uncharacterised protein [Prochlorococcus marinus str. MIT 9313]